MKHVRGYVISSIRQSEFAICRIFEVARFDICFTAVYFCIYQEGKTNKCRASQQTINSFKPRYHSLSARR